MTKVETPVAANQQDRLIFGVRQAATLGMALLVAGLVTEQLRPEEAVDRGIVSTQFVWAIVMWAAVLILNAVAFQQSQMRSLEQLPLIAATGIGAVIFLIGLLSFDAGPLGRRLMYLGANSLGAAMFWWAILSLGWLLVRVVADHPSPHE